MSKPHALIVEVEVPPERMEEFLKAIENNAVGARKEPGCLQFDVLRTQDNPNKFIFFEVYKSFADLEFHRTTPHFLAMGAYRESGGFLSTVRTSADGEFTAF